MAVRSITAAPVARRGMPDLSLFLIALALTAAGLAMVHSASYPITVARGGDPAFHLKRQLVAALIGLLGTWMASQAPLRLLRSRLVVVLAVTAGLLLAAVLVAGEEVNGARRWFRFASLSFQPTELAKLVLVIWLAKWLADHRAQLTGLRGLVVPLFVIGTYCGLIVIEPDLGSAVGLGLGALVMLHLAGVSRKHLLQLIGCAAVLGVAAIAVEPYRLRRLTGFVELWLGREGAQLGDGYQTYHGLIGLGSGGIFGRGFCESREKYSYLPAANTDCIFAILGEELGLIGCLAVMAMFLFLIYRGLRAAHRSPDYFLALTAAGLTSMIALQVVINIAVVTASVPNTGIPLPFISFGGSSLIFALISVGLILNISRGTSIERDQYVQTESRRTR